MAFLEFTLFNPSALEPRRVSLRSDSIIGVYQYRTGDLFCTRIETPQTGFEVAEDYNDVKRMVEGAELKDRTGT